MLWSLLPGATGQCQAARDPLVILRKVQANDVARLLHDITKGDLTPDLISCKIEEWDHITGHIRYGQGYPEVPSWNEVPFFKGQKKIVLRNCGLINPDDIEEYIAVGGYQALYKVLIDANPNGVIEQIKASKLRGRGGAGYLTGNKWEFLELVEGAGAFVCGEETALICSPERSAGMKQVKVATVWLDGCSGCHMSLLDMDAAVISLGRKIDLVYGPLVDAQEFPEDVDVTLVEGAVSSQDDLNKVQKIRQRTNILISMGDCAVTGNVPAMRNSIPVQKLLQSIYADGADEKKGVPSERVPALLKQARPLREFVKVDICLPGCPPPSKTIVGVINDLLDGKKPNGNLKVKFG
jgi:NAD-reducing hydrogenase small subunit